MTRLALLQLPSRPCVIGFGRTVVLVGPGLTSKTEGLRCLAGGTDGPEKVARGQQDVYISHLTNLSWSFYFCRYRGSLSDRLFVTLPGSSGRANDARLYVYDLSVGGETGPLRYVCLFQGRARSTIPHVPHDAVSNVQQQAHAWCVDRGHVSQIGTQRASQSQTKTNTSAGVYQTTPLQLPLLPLLLRRCWRPPRTHAFTIPIDPRLLTLPSLATLGAAEAANLRSRRRSERSAAPPSQGTMELGCAPRTRLGPAKARQKKLEPHLITRKIMPQ